MTYVDELFEIFDPPEYGWNIATLATKASYSEYINPNVVKVVLGTEDRAMYFSRSPIPHGGKHLSLKQIGVYAYSSSFLETMWMLDGPANPTENLEQLQWVENGLAVKVLVRDMQTTGIDTQEDYDRFVNEHTKTSRS